jgi:hypothetical protein
MKMIMGLFVAAVFVIAPVTFSFAQEASSKTEVKPEMVKGKIVSVDREKNQIVVQQKDGTESTLDVDPKDIGFFKADNYVKAAVTAGTSTVESIHKLKGSEKRKAYARPTKQ